MNADVLLLSLHHPHPLLPHLVHDAEDVHHVVLPDALQDPVQGYHGARPSHPGAAVDDDGSLFRADTVTEGSDKSKIL